MTFSEQNILFVAFFIAVLIFSVSYILIPKLIGVIRFKNLMDNPNGRSSHLEQTPTLGGVAFYMSLILGLFFIRFWDEDDIGYSLIVGISILFFIGLKDDLMILSAKTKTIAQIVAISFLVVKPCFQTLSLHDLFGFQEIPWALGILLIYFIFFYVINAYNLIDGIDGLAASIGVFASLAYAMFFYFSGHYYYFLLSIIIGSFLMAFLPYNFSKTQKIFMGDTGALIVGFLLAVLSIRFVNLDNQELIELQIRPNNSYVIALSVLFFPIVDVLRVIFSRLSRGKSPFEPDRCHVHHILIDKGLSHLKATSTIFISTVVLFGIVYSLSEVLNFYVLLLVYMVLVVLTFSILIVLDQDRQSKSLRQKFKSLFPKWFQRLEFRLRKKTFVFLK
jgi:UDP-N-acetylmuramyl pentapeptide phosphotransferase/UDP-N-acetylglucosamine-1-phosphate transferase